MKSKIHELNKTIKFIVSKKTIITLSLSLLMIATVFAQKERRDERDDNKSSNCKLPAPKKITKGIYTLVESYNKLLNAKANNLCVSTSGTATSFGTMSMNTFGNSLTTTGNISFASFFEGGNLFRNVFANKESDYAYYGACAPNPIVWDADASACNHVFAVKLVSIQNFMAAGVNAAFLNTTAVSIADIQSIDCIKLEEANGYAAATEPANYNNIFSSKGILVLVSLKTGVQQWCYIINNYDNGGTLKWKE